MLLFPIVLVAFVIAIVGAGVLLMLVDVGVLLLLVDAGVSLLRAAGYVICCLWIRMLYF